MEPHKVQRIVDTLSLLQTNAKYTTDKNGKRNHRAPAIIAPLKDICFQFVCTHPKQMENQPLNLPQELATELLLHGIKKRVVTLESLAVLLTSNWIRKLEELSFRACPEKVTDDILATIGANMNSLAFLDVGYASRITPVGIERLCENSNSLQLLRMDRCLGLKGKVNIKSKSLVQLKMGVCSNLTDIRLQCPLLEAFDTTDCHQLKTVEWVGNPAECKIQKIEMFHCNSLLCESAEALLRSVGYSLQEASLSFVPLAPTSIAKILREDENRFKRLTYFDCPNLDDEGLMLLSRRCTQLKVLFLLRCTFLTFESLHNFAAEGSGQLEAISLPPQADNAALISVAKHNPKLKNIDMTENGGQNPGQITAAGITAVLIHCPSLVALAIPECDSLARDALDRAFSTEGVPQKLTSLRALNLYMLNVTDGSLRAIGSHCPNLADLDLTHNEFVTDEGVLAIVKSARRNLKRLALEFCRLISDDLLVQIAKECPLLDIINVYGCSQVTLKGISAIVRHCPKLSLLNVPTLQLVQDVQKLIVDQKLDDRNELKVISGRQF